MVDIQKRRSGYSVCIQILAVAYEGKVSVFVDALVGSGHLLPVNDMKGNRQQAYARGLTPKGVCVDYMNWNILFERG